MRKPSLFDTALLAMDFQRGILAMNPDSVPAVAAAAQALEAARQTGVSVIHVGLGFAPGHPEIPKDLDNRLGTIRDQGLFTLGSESAEFHPDIYREGEPVIHKHRFGAFSENHLHFVLRSMQVQKLVLCGVSTSGVVLSTVRRAFDLDFDITVLSDACHDRDEEVHRVLTQKIFPAQGRVMTVREWTGGLGI